MCIGLLVSFIRALQPKKDDDVYHFLTIVGHISSLLEFCSVEEDPTTWVFNLISSHDVLQVCDAKFFCPDGCCV